jgi:hypothetical protein
VLHVAAAHGRDAADLDRAAELLMLCRVHPTLADAEAALAAARRSTTAREPDDASRLKRLAATQIGAWLAVRAVERIFPGTGVLVATLVSRGAVQGLGVRAATFYQG